MIPKIIHYCWFGNNPKSDEIKNCIASWGKTCPDFIIKEWNEQNFDVESFPFTKKMHNEKKWAFVADYARLYILEHEGGFYLDTDMFLLQPLSSFTKYSCVLGEEERGIISAGMIASTAHHPFIQKCKDYYDTPTAELNTIPRILTNIYNKYNDKASITVLPPRNFYPFNAENIRDFHGQELGVDVYGVHLWHHSWGSPLNKFFKKIGIYSFGKKISEILGIKQILKKLLGFI